MKKLSLAAAFSLLLCTISNTVSYANHPVPKTEMVDETRTEQRHHARARGRVNRTLLQSDPNPCHGKRGLYLQECLVDLRNQGNWADDRGYRVRKLPTENRRTAALKARAKRQKGILVPRITGEYKNIQLDTPLRRTRFIPNEAIIDSIQKDKPLLQNRAVSGQRKIGTQQERWSASPQLCPRRKGIRLINCLNELGIEINKNTVDESTMKIWQNMQGGH